ncbi:MAG: helix-turn-helix domain-containing protein [Bacteroidota bacterium]
MLTAQIPVTHLPLVVGIFLALLLIPLLWIRHLGNEQGNRILAGLVLLMGMANLGPIFGLPDFTPRHNDFFIISSTIVAFYGPLIFLYMRSFVERDFQLKKVDWLHLTPFILVSLVKGVYWQELSGVSRQQMQTWIQQDLEPPLAFRMQGLLIFLSVLVYLVLCIRLLRNFRRHLRRTASYQDTSRYRWLLLLFTIFFLPIIAAIFGNLMFRELNMGLAPAYGAGLMLLGMLLIYILAPHILAGFPEPLKLEPSLDEHTRKRYQKSPLDDAQKEKYLGLLLSFMEKQQAYLRPELTLAEVAQELNMNTRYLSQVINEKQGKNFMDFINQYRIEHAKILLTSPAYQQYTIVAITQEAGFKSRSAFYEAFRKFTGVTPSEYRKRPASG